MPLRLCWSRTVTEPHYLTLDQLLDRALSDRSVEVELHRRYSRQAAVVVVDFTGMVHRTDHDGIIYALALARAAENQMRPAVLEHHGEVVKRVADSFFAVFPTATDALSAALDGRVALAEFNQDRSGHIGDGTRTDAIHACIGLGFGATLIIPGDNLYGAEVNRAFVLGEDTANAGEMLCTSAFLDSLGPPPAGVGAHQVPRNRRDTVGFEFHQLTDFRA
jgi:class 3 adenylate cyclase